MRALIAVACLVELGASAHAASDYAPSSAAWNGLSGLMAEAEALRCPVRPIDDLDWSTLDARDVVWFVYPRRALDGLRLRRFLAAGGHALIADDFGSAEAALAELELARHTGPLDDVAHYQSVPSLPVAHTTLATPLGRSTESLVANHPAWFVTRLPPTFAFRSGAALVVEAGLGKGAFVALSDPSVLVNTMLALDGNHAFARALVLATCRPGVDHILLVAPDFVARGEPPRNIMGGSGDRSSTEIDEINRALVRINQAAHRAIQSALVPLGVSLSGLALVLLALAFPPRTRTEAHFARAAQKTDVGYDGAVARYGQRKVASGYALPLTIVREEVRARLQLALPSETDVTRLSPSEIAARLARARGPAAGAAAASLWRLLFSSSGAGRGFVSLRLLRQVHALAVSLFVMLEADEPT